MMVVVSTTNRDGVDYLDDLLGDLTREQFKFIIHNDTDRRGSWWSMLKCFEYGVISGEDHILYMQDDIRLSSNLKEYLEDRWVHRLDDTVLYLYTPKKLAETFGEQWVQMRSCRQKCIGKMSHEMIMKTFGRFDKSTTGDQKTICEVVGEDVMSDLPQKAGGSLGVFVQRKTAELLVRNPPKHESMQSCDAALGKFCKHNNLKLIRPRISLVSHEGAISSISDRPITESRKELAMYQNAMDCP